MNRKQRRAESKKKSNPAPVTTAGKTDDPHAELRQSLIEQTLRKTSEIIKLGKTEEAISILKALSEHMPGEARIPHHIGQLYKNLDRPEDAEPWFKKATELDPKRADSWFECASIALEMKRTDEALEMAGKAADLAPDNAQIRTLYGNMFSVLGQLDEALENYHKALKINPAYPSAYYNIGTISKYTKDDPAFHKLAELIREDWSDQPVEKQVELNFAMAKACHDIREYDDAFLFLKKGNDLKRSETDYDTGFYTQYFDEIIENFTADLFETHKGSGHPTEKPIFIVGMPRSGTTLTEQILASHPDVRDTGELPLLQNSVPAYKNPNLPGFYDQSQPTLCKNLIDNLNPKMLNKIEERYTAKATEIWPDAERITNKLPFNFIWTGLIKLAMPNAKIIHIERDPVDTCLSCYRQLFTAYLPWAWDLQELGQMYNNYKKLMAHWNAILGEDLYHLRYEALVNNQEDETRKLIEYCGLPWDDACIDFHSTDRDVRTASVAQVRQPIYNTSMKAWKKYEAHLTPLLQELGYDKSL